MCAHPSLYLSVPGGVFVNRRSGQPTLPQLSFLFYSSLFPVQTLIPNCDWLKLYKCHVYFMRGMKRPNIFFIIYVVRSQVGLPDYGPKSAERVLQRIFYVSPRGFFTDIFPCIVPSQLENIVEFIMVMNGRSSVW